MLAGALFKGKQPSCWVPMRSFPWETRLTIHHDHTVALKEFWELHPIEFHGSIILSYDSCRQPQEPQGQSCQESHDRSELQTGC